MKSEILKRKNSRNSGFTILELLVVIAIAAMIMSFVLVSISGAKQRSRDARREVGIKSLQNALSIYVTTMNIYPVCASEVVIGSPADTCIGPILISAGVLQPNQVPVDPLLGTSGTCGLANSYAYCYQSTNGSTYAVRYALETNTISGKAAGWQPAIGP